MLSVMVKWSADPMSVDRPLWSPVRVGVGGGGVGVTCQCQ